MIVAYTIVTRNHLHRARVLMASVAAHQPDAARYVILADALEGKFDPRSEEAHVIEPSELNLPRYRALAFALDPASLCYALKPTAALFLQQRHPGAEILYFDSDTKLYCAPTELIAAARQHGIVLTPHLLQPERNEPAQRETMRSGAYNGGVFAVNSGSGARAFLHWWQVQMSDPRNVKAAWNHDQGWLNLVPALFPETHLLRHPGYNVAFWNLHERTVIQDSAGHIRVDDQPLVLFHFSYFEARKPHLLAAPFGLVPTNEAVRALLKTYADELLLAGEDTCVSWGTALRHFRNGRPITSRHREYFIARLWDHFPDGADPFDPNLGLPAPGLRSLYHADHWCTRFIRALRR